MMMIITITTTTIIIIIIIYCSKRGTFLKFNIYGAYVTRVMVNLCF